MIRFQQYLEEHRAAYWYHATDTSSAHGIIDSNIFKPKTKHNFGNSRNEFTLTREIGTSFTRSLKYAKVWGTENENKFGYAIFVVDPRSIKLNNRSEPFNYWHSSSNVEYAKLHVKTRDSSPQGMLRMPESEEFVIGAITNAYKHIVKVMFSKQEGYDRAFSFVSKYEELHHWLDKLEQMHF